MPGNDNLNVVRIQNPGVRGEGEGIYYVEPLPPREEGVAASFRGASVSLHVIEGGRSRSVQMEAAHRDVPPNVPPIPVSDAGKVVKTLRLFGSIASMFIQQIGDFFLGPWGESSTSKASASTARSDQSTTVNNSHAAEKPDMPISGFIPSNESSAPDTRRPYPGFEGSVSFSVPHIPTVTGGLLIVDFPIVPLPVPPPFMGIR